MSASREQFQEHVLGFLWRQWSALGVAGQSQPVDRWMLDPEALLLATTSLGRDPRLFDEVLDWLNTNGQFINLQRLQNLGQRFGDLTVLRAMAAHLAGRSVHAKWKTLLREKPTMSEAQPLFPGVPVFGSPDELFARHGWQRGPVTLRQLSQPADPHRPTNFLIKLRALFGMQARAETVRYATRVLVKLIEICFLRRSSRVECLRPAGGRRGNHSIASGSGRRHQGFSRTVACFVSVEVAGAKKLETKQGWF